MPSEQAPGQARGWWARVGPNRLGTRLVPAVAVAALIAGGLYLVDHPDATPAGPQATSLSGPVDGARSKVGSPAQDFTTTTVDGKKVSLSSHKGHPVWLTFGATWCASCQAEAPDIQAAYEKFKAKGVVVLAIFISEDSQTVRDYAARAGLTYPQAADPSARIASAYGVYEDPGGHHGAAIRSHFFIDASGILRSMTTGTLTPAQMDAALRAISQ